MAIDFFCFAYSFESSISFRQVFIYCQFRNKKKKKKNGNMYYVGIYVYMCLDVELRSINS